MNSSVVPECPPSADSAFGPIVSGCRDDFDFTLAFEAYFFSIAPSAILLLLAPWRLLSLRKRAGVKVVIGGDAWKYTKIAVITLYAATQLGLLVPWSTSPSFTPARDPAIAASVLSFLSSLLILLLSYYEHTRSPRPSAILNAYLFLSLLLDGAVLRTLWMQPFVTVSAIRGCFTAGFVLKFAVMILEAMEKGKHLSFETKTPEETSGLYSQGLYWWLNGVLRNGWRKVLRMEDLHLIDDAMAAEKLTAEFWRYWNKSTRTKHKLALVMAKMLKWPLMASVFPRFILLGFTFCQPFLVTRFLDWLQDEDADPRIGYGLIGAYGVVYLGMAISGSFYWHRDLRALTMLRGALISAVYTKTTEISITALDNAAAVTLMSADVETIVRGMREVHELWASVVQIALATWLLQRQLGAACVAPVVVAVVSALATIWMSGKTEARMGKWLQMIHKRIGITSSMIGHMKGIKMSGLSHRLQSLIAGLRVDEVRSSKSFRRLSTYTATIASVPSMISPVLTFAVFAAVAHRDHTVLDATKLFTSLSLLMLLSQPLFAVFEGILNFRTALGCFERIGKFLSAESREDHRLSLHPSAPSSSSGNTPRRGSSQGTALRPMSPQLPAGAEVINIRDGSFGWKKDAEPTLQDINLSIRKGTLNLLIGPVASGKSTLLKAILGETPSSKGFVRMATREIAWCEQTPWLTNASIQKNIIGFRPFDSDLYKQVLHCCDLEDDIALLPDGDMTKVGSKGITLSGGQKQRVALARAAYARTSIAIFDDIFSGLDARTSRNVFSRLFGSDGLYRKRGTTVIVATHAVNLLPWADHIIALSEEGKVAEQGTLEYLNTQDGYVKSFYLEHKVDLEQERISEVGEGVMTERSYKPELTKKSDIDDEKDKRKGDLSVYAYYFSTIGCTQTVLFFFLEVAWSFFSSFPTVWLKWWTDANASSENDQTGKYLGVYAMLQVVGLLFSAALVWFTFQNLTATSGIKLHNVILKTVMSAPMSFFSKTDTGSITNRFSQDIQLIDHSMPLSVMCVVNYAMISFAHVILIATASPWLLLTFPFLFFAFFIIQSYYLRTSRQLRLLEIEAKAPVYTQFLESLSGLSTIRAYDWVSSCISRVKMLLDDAQKPFYLFFMVQRWLTLVLDLVIMALAVVVVGVVVALKLHGGDNRISVGFTGVALTQIISLAGYVRLTILFWVALETSSGAVTRVRDFERETENEYKNNKDGETGETEEGWPRRGELEFKDAQASYRVNDTEHKALNGLSLSIKAGERVGICGRTGSGKSTLVSTLFRLLDPTSGSIHVDGRDISTLPLEIVRDGITSIPQESYFIAGTVRLNLDPYSTSPADAKSDEECLSALKKVNLEAIIEEKGGLDAELDPESLSHGQRQLFCLARAILRGGRILVIDEATSSVDLKTDEMMQKVIREEFPHGKHTVIAVAHRLETIIDFDRLAVLDGGRVVEYDSPEVLLKKEDGVFKELYQMSRMKTSQEEAKTTD